MRAKKVLFECSDTHNLSGTSKHQHVNDVTPSPHPSTTSSLKKKNKQKKMQKSKITNQFEKFWTNVR